MKNVEAHVEEKKIPSLTEGKEKSSKIVKYLS